MVGRGRVRLIYLREWSMELNWLRDGETYYLNITLFYIK